MSLKIIKSLFNFRSSKPINIDSPDPVKGKQGIRETMLADTLNQMPAPSSLVGEDQPLLSDRDNIVALNVSSSAFSQAVSQSPINDRPFDQFWALAPGAEQSTDTVNHQLMVVNENHPRAYEYQGIWHVKTPGYESSGEKLKRFVQKLMYWITGKKYKANYYDDRQLLAQKEVLAGRVYKAAVSDGDISGFHHDYQMAYSVNNSTDEAGRAPDHCIASRHLEGYEDGKRLADDSFMASIIDKKDVFDLRHNPVICMIIRRFLLGDEDYLKLDNYMVKQGKEGEPSRVVNIDFGMSFYNVSPLPKKRITIKQFMKIMMRPSKKHRIQYLLKPTIHTVIDAMDKAGQKSNHLAEEALHLIANMTDDQLEVLSHQIYHPDARSALLTILMFKRNQAAAILDDSLPWPAQPGRPTISALVS